MKRFFHSVINRATLYFSIIVSLFCCIMLFSHSANESISLDPLRILLFLPFCVFFAVSNYLLKFESIGAFTKWLLHFFITTTSSYLFIILPAKLPTASGNFIGLVLIITIYFVGLLLYTLITIRIRKTISEDKKLISKSQKKK